MYARPAWPPTILWGIGAWVQTTGARPCVLYSTTNAMHITFDYQRQHRMRVASSGQTTCGCQLRNEIWARFDCRTSLSGIPVPHETNRRRRNREIPFTSGRGTGLPAHLQNTGYRISRLPRTARSAKKCVVPVRMGRRSATNHRALTLGYVNKPLI